MIRRRAREILGVLVILLAVVVRSAPAHAEDRVGTLTRLLASRSDKTRLSAVLALAKLADPDAIKPLVSALHDSSVRVRAVAATALGRLEYRPALAALRELAIGDVDRDVRSAASNATLKIEASHRADDRAKPAVQARRAALPTRETDADEPHPDLYVQVRSAADDSPTTADKAARQIHATVVKQALLAQLRTEPSVTSSAEAAQHWGLEARQIDVSVTKLALSRSASMVEIDAELRLTISDDNGKLLSFLSGGAKLQVPNQKFDPRYTPVLRKDALENAMRGMFGKLLAHLHDQAPI